MTPLAVCSRRNLVWTWPCRSENASGGHTGGEPGTTASPHEVVEMSAPGAPPIRSATAVAAKLAAD